METTLGNGFFSFSTEFDKRFKDTNAAVTKSSKIFDFENFLQIKKFGPVLLEFIVEIKYIRIFVEQVLFFLSWSEPFYTIRTLGCVSFFIWFFEYFLVGLSLIMWTPLRKMILSRILEASNKKKESLEEKAKSQKSNFAFIQFLQQKYLDMLHLITQKFFSKDKTNLVRILNALRFAPIVVAVGMLVVSTRLMILSALWGMVVVNHPWAKKFGEESLRKVKTQLKLDGKKKRKHPSKYFQQF